VLEQVKIEKKDEKYRMDRIQQGLVISYEKIPKSEKTIELTTTQKIDQIMH
jgi:hypothetical protein